jgi:lipopolysaccharide/colanic/teichoic acid biosynthesis glycosyltransferase
MVGRSAPAVMDPRCIWRSACAAPVALTRYQQERRRQRRLLVGALLLADALAVILALVSAGNLRLAMDGVLPVAALGLPDRHLAASVIAVPVLLVLFWLVGHYDVDNCMVGTRDYTLIAHGATYGLVIALALSYFSGGEPLVSRSWLLLVWTFCISFVGLERFIARRIVRHLRRRGLLHTRVVIVGASTSAVALAAQLRECRGEGIEVVGFLDEYVPLGDELLPGAPVMGRPDQLIHPGRGELADVDEYVFVPQALPYERLEDLTHLMVMRHGPVLRMAVTSRELLTHGLVVSERGHVPLVTLQRASISGADAVLKRGLDIIGALLALVIVGPAALGALTWSYLIGKRPLVVPEVIYAPGGGHVQVWLIAEHVSARLAIRGVPALLHVLSGDLSLVGPRPIPCDKSTHASSPPSWVTALRPGLTGPWRLSGPSASIEQQTVQDLAYVRDYSIWNDLRILGQSARPGALLARWHARQAPSLVVSVPQQVQPHP